jgi:hypothetical protein
VSEAAVKAWDQLAGRLTPIIGQDGFRALYRRSLHLTAASFSWLSPPTTTSVDLPFADLGLRLQNETPARAEEASRALFATFTRLLNDLIGESLTTRILAPISRDGGSGDSTREISK